MSLLFIHGVNNRTFDKNYKKGKALRDRMLETLLLPHVREKYNSFDFEEDIYWGGLGISFAWDLVSVPKTVIAEDMGAAKLDELDPGTPEYLASYAEMIDELARRDDQNDPLGAKKQLLVEIVNEEGAAKVISLLVSPIYAHLELEASRTEEATEQTKKQDQAAIEIGKNTADLLIVLELLQRDAKTLEDISSATTDEAILNKFQERIGTLAQEAAAGNSTYKSIEAMGITDDLASWINDRAAGLKANADSLIKKVKNATIDDSLRASSLVFLKRYRQGLSNKAFLFVGDVFEYLQRGWSDENSIAPMVKKAVIKGFENSQKRGEPFVVLTHSFGSMILYDLLSSDQFKEVPGFAINLWAMAGSQVSMFAEMRLFRISPKEPVKCYPIEPLSSVRKWINIWDPADLVSYLAEPVFTKAEVTDIKMRRHANVANAHGDYFAQPVFYEHLVSAILGKQISVNEKTAAGKVRL